ncbi:GPW/gp25 family protein [Chromobacterium subtsugae]|uniref:GPW/gp25 family protein n=1 Tax=Chromobacterium subtsugae TaxID=251747 RepID=UPI00064154D2|nr:GPW/gp25 family protein [Chromobacterium subtsugae]
MSGFLGRGWQFPVRFDTRAKRVAMVEDAEDIAESLRILLGTHPGERVMLPRYGCPLRPFLFRSANTTMLTELRGAIRDAVLFFEARIELESVETTVPEAGEGRVDVTLVYRIRSSNARYNLVYPLYLDQGVGSVNPY